MGFGEQAGRQAGRQAVNGIWRVGSQAGRQ